MSRNERTAPSLGVVDVVFVLSGLAVLRECAALRLLARCLTPPKSWHCSGAFRRLACALAATLQNWRGTNRRRATPRRGERRLAVLLDDHALPNVGYPTTIRT